MKTEKNCKPITMYISGENEMNHFHYPLGDLLTGWMLKTLWPKKTKHMPLSTVYLLSDIVAGGNPCKD